MGKAAKVYPRDSDQPVEVAPLPVVDAIYDYELDFADWLDSGDVLTNLTVNAPAFLSVTGESTTGSKAVAFFENKAAPDGALEGARLPVEYNVTSANGREDTRTIIIPIAKR